MLHIDGTKIEVDANRYTFVWKKDVLKHRQKLFGKITQAIKAFNTFCDLSIPIQQTYKASSIKSIVKKVETKIEKIGINLVYGKGKRKHPLQRLYVDLCQYEGKMNDFEKHLSIMGSERNSYAKTDHDATFLNMKEDHMLNSQLKPSYNVQIGVINGYIRLIEAYPYRNDLKTFEPFLEKYYTVHNEYPLYPVADAGYGRYDTYHYCLSKGMELYQKHNMWEKERSKAYQKNPFNRINFEQDKNRNYIFPKGRKLTYRYSTKNKYIKSPHKIKVYKSLTCKRCPLQSQCKKTKDEKIIHVNETWDAMKTIVRENLESPRSINLRIQRFIQVEGAFGVINEDMRFRRFSRTGFQGITNELNLIAIGYNLRKYHNKSQRIIQ